MKFARIGLIVNPSAGGGEGLSIARQAIRALASQHVLVGAGEMGADALSAIAPRIDIFDWRAYAGKARTAFLSECFAKENVDAIVVVGGDGTLADVALALRGKQSVPLFGIGAGSANVGPLITCQAKNVQQLVDAKFTVRSVDGLIAGVNDVPLGLGFNDVVIGLTVLATQNGRMIDVDAVEKMQGRNVAREPESIGADDARVIKKSARGETLVAQGRQVVTIIVGLPDERFYGKAIAGGVLLSGLTGDPAGCLVCDHLLVRTQMDADWFRRSEPVTSYYVGLNETEKILTSGLREGAVLCADGNPLAILRPTDRAYVMVQRALAHSIRIEASV
ncbi:MAG: NAD(+)/NADH kinase [Chloroflexi bacterium]|nr:NAD(+)/NADH kinase [Chloroflexota bacterium]